MTIVLISESLLSRSTVVDGRLLRDRVLSGFCVRMNARRRTFRVATSVAGKQFRMTLGYWPLMSVEVARQLALDVIRQCRNGERPGRQQPPEAIPSLREAHAAYCVARKIKASSQKRYDSIYRTHFGGWLDRPVTELGTGEFSAHCHAFAQTKGNALVEVGRGVVTALIKYVNAVHGLSIEPPFTKLAAAGLMPERSQPRARVLQIDAASIPIPASSSDGFTIQAPAESAAGTLMPFTASRRFVSALSPQIPTAIGSHPVNGTCSISSASAKCISHRGFPATPSQRLKTMSGRA